MNDKIKIFNRGEELWEKVSHERLLEILAREDVDVVECDISDNHFFIECQYVHIRTADGQHFAFYGNGEHSQMEKWIADEWCWYGDSNVSLLGRDKKPACDKAWVLSEIEEQREKVLRYKAEEEGNKRSGKAKAYEWAVDLIGDDDGLEGDLEDFFGDDFDDFEDWDD